MNTKVTINPNYDHLSSFINRLPNEFASSGHLLFYGRNELRVFTVDGLRIVVKSYNKLTLANRYIYGLFRKSKGQRAYENALLLQNYQISTPDPIAFIDCYRNGRLVKNYFISLFVSMPQLGQALGLPLSENYNLLVDFARFTFNLHEIGIFHGDYQQNNILCAKTDKGYDFILIDNNRFKLQKKTKHRAMRNLERLYLPIEKYAVFAAEYARLANENEIQTIQSMLLHHQILLAFQKTKKQIKQWFRPISNLPLSKLEKI